MTTAPRNDVERFAELYSRHRTAVYGFLEGMLGDATAAEELAQNVFLAAFRRLGTLGRESPVALELYRLAYQAARQRRGLAPWRLVRRPSASAAADDLVAGLQTLATHERAALLLRDRDGLSYEEIAEILDCSLGAVRAWIASARIRLVGQPSASACALAAALASAEFDDRLDPEERATLEAHRRICASCAGRRAAYAALRDGLRRVVHGAFGAAREAELFTALRLGESGGRGSERMFGWVALASVLIAAWSVLLLFARATALPDEPPVAAQPKLSPVPVVAEGTLYVLNQTTPGAITVVDGPTHTVLRRMDLPFRPTSLAWDALRGRFYVARGQNAVALVDASTGRSLGELPLPYPAWGIVLAPDGRSLYASHFTNSRVSRVDVETGQTLREFALGGRPFSLVPHASGRWLFVGAAPGKLLRFDVQTGREVGAYTFDLPSEDVYSRVVAASSPDGRTVYGALLEGGQIVALDVASGRARRATVRARGTARFAVVSPDGSRLVVSYSSDRPTMPSVLVVRTDNLTEVTGTSEPSGLGIAVDGGSKVLYVTQPSLGLLYAYDLETGQLLGAADVGGSPGPVLFLGGS